MKNLLELKQGIGSVKDVDRSKRIVTGYLTHFGDIDSHNDIIDPRATHKTVNERMTEILFLNQHRWDQPHGFFGRLNPDEKGLYFESKKLPNTTYSNDAIELYDAGIISDHSIGFIPVKYDIDEETGVRTLKEIKLYEGSNVTVGANRNTPFLGFKSMTIEQLNDQTKRMVKMLRTGTLTDETFVQLEIGLKQIQMESYRRGKEDAQTPPGDGSTVLPQKSNVASAIQLFTESLKI
jgi:HK97 family phage prohead protease